MKFSQIMDPNHPEAKDFKELADYKWFKVVNFQWKGQDHYRIQGGGDGFASLVVRKDGKFVMIRQNRPLFDCAHLEGVCGGVDDGETLEESVRREVFEETGYRTSQVEKITSFSSDVVKSLSAVHLFWVEVENEPECLPSEKDLPDAQLVVLDKMELVEAIRSGEIHALMLSNILHILFLRRDPLLKELIDLL